MADASRVYCSGPALKFGYMNNTTTAIIDTREAGSGDLAAVCRGPKTTAYTELKDNKDGTYGLKLRPKEIGEHSLSIRYDGLHVEGSPFRVRVSTASLVRLQGYGLDHSVLSTENKGHFLVDSESAGPGNVGIKIGGPPGSFKLKTKKKGRYLSCKYNPKRRGHYHIHVTWAGDPVPGSPFTIFVAKNHKELERYRMQLQPDGSTNRRKQYK